MATTSLNLSGSLEFPDGTRQLSSSGHLKNRILNGKMQIDQLGGGFITSSAPAYSTNMCMWTIDRWIFSSTGVATYAANVNQVIIGSGQHAKTALKLSANTVALASGGYPTNFSGFAQRIESIYTEDLVNCSLTISANISLAQPSTVYCALYYPNTKDTYGQKPLDWFNDLRQGHPASPAQTNPVYFNCSLISVQSFVAYTNQQTYRVSTGKMPVEVRNGLMVYFYVGTGTNYQELTITDVVLEKGPTNPPPGWIGYTLGNYSSLPSVADNRSLREELALCRRYLYCEGVTLPNASSSSNYKLVSLGNIDACLEPNTGHLRTSWRFKTPMYGGPKSYSRMVYMSWPYYESSPGTYFVPYSLKWKFNVGAGGYSYPPDPYNQYSNSREFTGSLYWMYSEVQNLHYINTGSRKDIVGATSIFRSTTPNQGATYSNPFIIPTIRLLAGGSPNASRTAIGFRMEL